jgi:hypothetical protein
VLGTVLLVGLLVAGCSLLTDLKNVDQSVDQSKDRLKPLDNVTNDVTGTPPTATITAGGSVTVNYKIVATGGDGQTGCNAADGTPATVTPSVPSGVTKSPASLTFTTCGVNQSVVFSSSTPGTYAITVSVSDAGPGSYNTAPATFTLQVNPPPDSTPPVITFTGTAPNANGWNNTDVTVSWSVTDPESAISSSSGCDTVVVTAETSGTTYTCTATSAGGTSSQSVTVKIDKTKPVISGSASPAPNANGWNNTDVTVSFSCAEVGSVQSGIDTNTVAGATLTSEGAGQSVTNTGTCTDKAGNVADSATVSGINIDKTKPTASASASPAANANGWNNTNVTVSFSGSDALSGIDFCDAPVVLSSEGAGQSASGTCTDKAGNVSDPATVSGINIDKTPPSVSVTGVTNGATYTLGSVPVAGCSTTDALSGVQTPATVSVSGGPVVGAFTATCSGAVDKADNPQAAPVSVSYTVQYNFIGFLQPVDNPPTFNVAKAGRTIPVKWQLPDGNGGFISSLSVVVNNPLRYRQINCDATSPSDPLPADTSGSSGLRYDSTTNQYIFTWQTSSTFAGKCYELLLDLNDGTQKIARFKFTK